ncbi:MAG: adenylate/guanylate cyclase domain-containing protein, partial [Rhodospirillales bacterium]|nr:adenylate/guanylate cyclase domain-containing protein [Rhodospirillales bacterium]
TRRPHQGGDQALGAGHGELCDAAILNLDLRGFTPFAAKAPPDAVMALLADYQTRMVPLIRKHGGSIDKFLGDGILATFGAASKSPTYASDALHALDEIMIEVAAWSESYSGKDGYRPKVNGAVAAGRVLFGVIGAADRLEYTVIGEAVNLSAKLEKANKTVFANALCDGPTFDLACAQGYRPKPGQTRLADVQVAGVEAALDLVVLAAGATQDTAS